ncbi:hypothetical protein HYT26_01450 [Candidatus Pacearchaeota archaeon]|nr:hypothetical protein [Candidatus Pacearchaeota archaeon]
MEKLIKTLFKACFAVWFLIAMLSFVILACLKEIFYVTDKQGNIIALAVALWILVPIILAAAIESVKSSPEKERVHEIRK